MRFVKVFLILLIISVFYVHGADPGEVSISIIPGGVLPVGEYVSSFNMGGGAGLTVDFSLGSLPFVFIRTAADYGTEGDGG